MRFYLVFIIVKCQEEHWQLSYLMSNFKVSCGHKSIKTSSGKHPGVKFERTLIVWNVSMNVSMIPFPHCHIIHTLRYPQYTQNSVNPPFCVYTLPHNFAFSKPPFHTQIWTSWLLHFFLSPPPRGKTQCFKFFIYIYVVLCILNIFRSEKKNIISRRWNVIYVYCIFLSLSVSPSV